MSTASKHLIEAARTANLAASDLIAISAAALAEQHCDCAALSEGTCPACREATRLADRAATVDTIEQSVGLIQDAAESCGATLGGLLPGIVSEILDRHAENCAGEPCPTCAACRTLDQVAA